MQRHDSSKNMGLNWVRPAFLETSRSATHRYARQNNFKNIFSLFVLPLVMIGCNATPTPATTSQPTPQHQALVPDRVSIASRDNDVEVPAIAALYGVWNVVGVSVSERGPTAFIRNDPSILGSQVTISKDLLVWSKTASSNFDSEDRCLRPNLRQLPIAPRSQSEFLEFTPAAKQLSVEIEKEQSVHTWLCVGGGEWGPAADNGARLLIISQDRFLMGWYDGVILLFERAPK
jgi:hypothetical protein